MKSDSISVSKCTESCLRTVIYTSDDNGINQGNIHFKFSDNSIYSFDLATISCINPIYFSSFNSTSDIEILFPKSITYSHIMDFLFIFNNGLGEYENCTTETSKKLIYLLQISEFFRNESFSIEFIKEIILKQLNVENSIDFLKFSYDKLSFSTSINIENDDIWFDLFYKALEVIGKNVDCFINNLPLIKQFDYKIVNELIEKICSHLILGNFILIETSNFNATHPNDDGNNNNNNNSNRSYEIEGENFFESMHFETKGNLRGGINNNNKEMNKNQNNIIFPSEQQEIAPINEKKEINFISMTNLESIISLLYEHKKCANFFDTITQEQMDLYSTEATKELKESPHPTFQVKIPYDFDNFYEEYSIDQIINNKKVVFVVYYKQSEDSFNVSIKLADRSNDSYNSHSPNNISKHQLNHSEEKYCFKILSFYSIVSINDEESSINSSQTNMKSLSNKKSMNNIFTMSNFKALIKSKVANHSNGVRPIEQCNTNVMMDNNGFIHLIDNSDVFSFDSDSFFSLKIYLKLCYTHSVLASYLLRSFDRLCHDHKINKISKQLLLLIIKNKYLIKSSEDEVVIALLNWLNDEINIKEDVTELFDLIKWNNVSDDLIFELLMKYSHMIINEDIENIFIKAFNEKEMNIKKRRGKDYVATKDLIGSFFTAAKRVNYYSIYNQMIKNSKFNLINASLSQKIEKIKRRKTEKTEKAQNDKRGDYKTESNNNNNESNKRKIKSTGNLTLQTENNQQWNRNKIGIETIENEKHINQSKTKNLINFFNKQNQRLKHNHNHNHSHSNIKVMSKPKSNNQAISKFTNNRDKERDKNKEREREREMQVKKINNIALKSSSKKVIAKTRSTTPNINMRSIKELKQVSSSKLFNGKTINYIKQHHYERKQSKNTTPIKHVDYLQPKYDIQCRSNVNPMSKLVNQKSKADLNDNSINKMNSMSPYQIGIRLKNQIGLNKSTNSK